MDMHVYAHSLIHLWVCCQNTYISRVNFEQFSKIQTQKWENTVVIAKKSIVRVHFLSLLRVWKSWGNSNACFRVRGDGGYIENFIVYLCWDSNFALQDDSWYGLGIRKSLSIYKSSRYDKHFCTWESYFKRPNKCKSNIHSPFKSVLVYINFWRQYLPL